MFRVFLQVPGYGEELQAKEDLLLGILRLAETMGIRFAFPSSTVYVEQFPEKASPAPPYPSGSEDYQAKVKAMLKEFGDQHRQV